MNRLKKLVWHVAAGIFQAQSVSDTGSLLSLLETEILIIFL